ncbi:hypothetical protein D3C72_1341460 [compost metagenome]
MVKGIRLQKPSPKAMAASVGLAPMAMVATATIITARAANTQESGNQRSAKLEQRRAKRAERLSSISAATGVPRIFMFVVVFGAVTARLDRRQH